MTQDENPYAPPRAEVSDPKPRKPDKPTAGARFLWAAGICFVIFVILVMLVLPRGDWIAGALGSAMFATLSGLVAMCIPVKNKAGFIVPALVVSMVLAYIVGSGAEDEVAGPLPAVESE
jgi:hypothetical protein